MAQVDDRDVCPSENTVTMFAQGDLAAVDADRVEAHLDVCEVCAEVVAELVRVFGGAPASRVTPASLGETVVSGPRVHGNDAWLAPGDRVSRYRVLEVVGAGGMGVVYAAYDPDLDRRVALKLLHDGGASSTAGNARPRLLREAQALARLSHPNVVAVHDVGAVGDRLFLAMEFIDGQTLTQWLGERKRSWPELRDVFIAAGRGLAAAHAAGITHRDFKPDNVLIDTRGNVRVTDFGLARLTGAQSQPDSHDAAEPALSSGSITQTGAIVGTPAYMAPEQFEPGIVDAAADQYSYCATLYEALFGVRPFTGKSLAELMLAVRSEPPREPPRDTRVPGRVRTAVMRGLSRDPTQRFPDMAALLAEIGRSPGRGWRSIALVTASIGALSLAVGAYVDRTRMPALCREDPAGSLWNDDGRARFRAAFDRALPANEEVWTTFAGGIDGWAVRWVALQSRACDPRNEEDAAAGVAALRMLCLAEHRAHLEATLRVVGKLADDASDTAALARAPMMIEALPSLDACDDIARMSSLRGDPVPPEIASEVVDASAALAEAEAMMIGGDHEAALAKAEEASTQIEALGYAPLLAELHLSRGRISTRLGRTDDAREQLEQSVELATRSGDRQRAARALIDTLYVVSESGNAMELGEYVAKQARSEIAHLGDPSDLLSRWHKNRATLLYRMGKVPDAIEELERALEVVSLDDQPLYRADILVDLANLQMLAFRFDEAEAHIAACRELLHAHLGRLHPNVAALEYSAGVLAATRFDWVGAQARLEAALEIRGATVGSRHPDYASDLATLGDVLGYQGMHDEAVARLEQALSLYHELHGPKHAMSLNVQIRLAQAYKGAGRFEDARREAAEATEIGRVAMSPGHPVVAGGLGVLAEALVELGRLEQAVEVFEAALEAYEAGHGPEHTYTSVARGTLGASLRAVGRLDEAADHLERAIESTKGDEVAAGERAWFQYLFARTQWERGIDRASVRARTEAAIDELHQRSDPERAQEAKSWLDSIAP